MYFQNGVKLIKRGVPEAGDSGENSMIFSMSFIACKT